LVLGHGCICSCLGPVIDVQMKSKMLFKEKYMAHCTFGYFIQLIFITQYLDLDGRCATNRYFQVIGNIHDIESYFAIDHAFSLNVNIFLCHWGHLAIIFMWLSAIHYHVGHEGNYQLWSINPINTIPIAHAVFDPHFALSEITNNISHSGIYNALLSLGFSSVSDLYNVVIASELLALISLGLAFQHLIYLDAFIQSQRFNETLLAISVVLRVF